jgi:hypothetical protein
LEVPKRLNSTRSVHKYLRSAKRLGNEGGIMHNEKETLE